MLAAGVRFVVAFIAFRYRLLTAIPPQVKASAAKTLPKVKKHFEFKQRFFF